MLLLLLFAVVVVVLVLLLLLLILLKLLINDAVTGNCCCDTEQISLDRYVIGDLKAVIECSSIQYYLCIHVRYHPPSPRARRPHQHHLQIVYLIYVPSLCRAY